MFTEPCQLVIDRMPLNKAKVYSRFNVGQMMKARRENREKAATAHISVVESKKTVNALNSKRRRLESKVNTRNLFSFGIYRVSTLIYQYKQAWANCFYQRLKVNY